MQKLEGEAFGTEPERRERYFGSTATKRRDILEIPCVKAPPPSPLPPLRISLPWLDLEASFILSQDTIYFLHSSLCLAYQCCISMRLEQATDKSNSISSGFPYPLPLHLIPANIYLVIRLILTLVLSKSLKNKNDYLKKHEHKAAPPFSSAADDPSVPWLFPSLPEIDFPLSFIPPNVTLCGPIVMEFSPVVDIDVELAGWLARGPTVVINLGSLFRYDERSASSMLGAIEFLFERVEDVQVLWKMPVLQDGGGDWVDVMKKVEGEGKRVRIEQWISAEMAAVLASETVIAAVHHGGASSYHEAIWLVTRSLPSLPPISLLSFLNTFELSSAISKFH